jgi:hypothetical protein
VSAPVHLQFAVHVTLDTLLLVGIFVCALVLTVHFT